MKYTLGLFFIYFPKQSGINYSTYFIGYFPTSNLNTDDDTKSQVDTADI